MTTAEPSSPSPKRRYFPVIAAALALAVILAGVVIFFSVGRWLVAENPLEKAQAIVVLSGGMPIRAMEAARLYHQGYAPQIWLTRPEQPAAALEPMGIPNSGEDYFNSKVLAHEGLPAGAVRILEPQINNTADEIRAIAAEATREGAPAVIIVTTKVHTRRVGRLWRQLASSSHCRAIIRAASTDSFDVTHWWRNTHDALDVVREVLGLLNSWAGLPLDPRP